MHVIQVMYPMPDDPEAFKSYYEQTHVPLAAKLPGLRDYAFGYPQSLGPEPSPWFCIFRGRFDDAAAMMAALGSEQGKLVGADVSNYSPKGAVMVHFEEQGD